MSLPHLAGSQLSLWAEGGQSCCWWQTAEQRMWFQSSLQLVVCAEKRRRWNLPLHHNLRLSGCTCSSAPTQHLWANSCKKIQLVCQLKPLNKHVFYVTNSSCLLRSGAQVYIWMFLCCRELKSIKAAIYNKTY